MNITPVHCFGEIKVNNEKGIYFSLLIYLTNNERKKEGKEYIDEKEIYWH